MEPLKSNIYREPWNNRTNKHVYYADREGLEREISDVVVRRLTYRRYTYYIIIIIIVLWSPLSDRSF